MIVLEHAAMMLRMAGKDMIVLQEMENNERIPIESFGFSAQQATEKALKAILIMEGVRFPKVHNLEELFDLCQSCVKVSLERFECLLDLTDFGVQFRYSPWESEDAPFDKSAVVLLTGELIALVQARLEEKREQQ